MSAKPDIGPGIFDAEQFAVVQNLLTPERLKEHLRNLGQQFVLLAGSSCEDTTLQSRAHKMVSQAGMLGLTRMSQCARALEGAHGSAAGQAVVLRECRAAARDVERFAMPAAERLPSARPSPV